MATVEATAIPGTETAAAMETAAERLSYGMRPGTRSCRLRIRELAISSSLLLSFSLLWRASLIPPVFCAPAWWRAICRFTAGRTLGQPQNRACQQPVLELQISDLSA